MAKEGTSLWPARDTEEELTLTLGRDLVHDHQLAIERNKASRAKLGTAKQVLVK